jgi:hypothetical protein
MEVRLHKEFENLVDSKKKDKIAMMSEQNRFR